jgi:hypothetical protein
MDKVDESLPNIMNKRKMKNIDNNEKLINNLKGKLS